MRVNPQVLMVIAFLDRVGGAQKQAMLLASELRELGAGVSFLSNRASGAARRGEIQGMPVSRAMFLGGWRLGHIKFHVMNMSMTRQMVERAENIDIIHVHQGLWPAYAAVTASKKIGKPCIVKIGNTGARFDLRVLERSPLKGRRMARAVASEADMFIATSSRAQKELIDYGVEAERITRIPNGVRMPPPITPEDRQAARRMLELPDDAGLILSVGSLEPHKRPELLAEAFALASGKLKNARLIFLGNGSMRRKIERKIHEIGLADRVECRLEVEEVDLYLRAADIFASVSSGEGMSNALLEAMAHGLACAVTGVSGAEDVISNGDNGLLISDDSPKGIADTLEKLLSDVALRVALGDAARRTVERDCSIDKIARRYFDLYAALSAR